MWDDNLPLPSEVCPVHFEGCAIDRLGAARESLLENREGKPIDVGDSGVQLASFLSNGEDGPGG